MAPPPPLIAIAAAASRYKLGVADARCPICAAPLEAGTSCAACAAASAGQEREEPGARYAPYHLDRDRESDEREARDLNISRSEAEARRLKREEAAIDDLLSHLKARNHCARCGSQLVMPPLTGISDRIQRTLRAAWKPAPCHMCSVMESTYRQQGMSGTEVEEYFAQTSLLAKRTKLTELALPPPERTPRPPKRPRAKAVHLRGVTARRSPLP